MLANVKLMILTIYKVQISKFLHFDTLYQLLPPGVGQSMKFALYNVKHILSILSGLNYENLKHIRASDWKILCL